MKPMPIFSLVVFALTPFMGGCREDRKPPRAIARVFPLPDCSGDNLSDLLVLEIPGAETEQARWGIVSKGLPPTSATGVGLSGGSFPPRLLYNAAQAGASDFPSVVQWTQLRADTEPRFATLSCDGVTVFNPRSLLNEKFDRCLGLGVKRRSLLRASQPPEDMKMCVLVSNQSDPLSVSCVMVSLNMGRATTLKTFNYQMTRPGFLLTCAIGNFVGNDEDDIVIGDGGESSKLIGAGVVSVFDGSTGRQIVIAEGPVQFGLCGHEVSSIHDADAKTRDLILVTSADFLGDRDRQGALVAIDAGANNMEVWRIVGQGMDSNIHSEFTVIDDCSGDGVEEVAFIDLRDNAVRVISGADGVLLATHHAGYARHYVSVCQLSASSEVGAPDLLCTLWEGAYRFDETGRRRGLAGVVISTLNGREKQSIYRDATRPNNRDER